MVVDMELEKLIEKGVIRECEDSEVLFLSHIFLRPKKNGKFRIISQMLTVQYRSLKNTRVILVFHRQIVTVSRRLFPIHVFQIG